MQKNMFALRFAKSGYSPAEPRRFLVATAALAAALLLSPVECSLAQSPGGGSTQTGTHLITLGTRVGPRPTAHQAQPSNLLVVNGTFYLIDAGDGVARRLAKAGIKFTDIGVIFITHVHSDHISGLGTLMALERHHGRQDPIDVYGPHGVETIVAATIQYFTPDAEIRWDEGLRGTSMQDMFRGHDVGPGLVYQDANIKVTAVENTHYNLTPANPGYAKHKSYAYRFETADKVVVFTGDTGPSQAVERLAEGADILVSEVLVTDDLVAVWKKSGDWDQMSLERQLGVLRHLTEEHLIPEEVGKLASSAHVKRVVLTHLILTGDDEADLHHYVDSVKQFYSGPVEVAKDLKQFSLR
jgi:ribonuclease BN (tRNA processing enzyme)